MERIEVDSWYWHRIECLGMVSSLQHFDVEGS